MWQCQITLTGVAAGATPPARTLSGNYFQKEDQSQTFTRGEDFFQTSGHSRGPFALLTLDYLIKQKICVKLH